MSYVSSKDDNNSSMRLNFILATLVCTCLLISVSIYIIAKAFSEIGVQDWSGMGVFVIGVLGGLTGLGFAKAQQKKYEIQGDVDIKKIEEEH